MREWEWVGIDHQSNLQAARSRTMARVCFSVAGLMVITALIFFVVGRSDNTSRIDECNPFAKACKPVEQAPPANYKRERLVK